nr:tRNA (5-methylaminomethyl-2-thiouridine)(34)-methyltransferase MnmD [Shewanella marina]
MNNIKVLMTKDGSHTLLNIALNESYHAHNGALSESKYVYIQAGLMTQLALKKQLNIVEVGFGTGLNTILTLAEAIKQNATIHYTSIEPVPLSLALIEQLNYGQWLTPKLAELYLAIHQAPWEQDVAITANFVLHKYRGEFEQFEFVGQQTDLIYFDAFAPNKQPEIWQLANMQKCAQLLVADGMLVSYCANGQFKRNLKAAGLIVKPYPGALGRREMTRAYQQVVKY